MCTMNLNVSTHLPLCIYTSIVSGDNAHIEECFESVEVRQAVRTLKVHDNIQVVMKAKTFIQTFMMFFSFLIIDQALKETMSTILLS